MALQEKLDAHKAKSRTKMDPAVAEVLRRATDDLERSGIAGKVARIGERAPDFALPDSRGRIVRLSDALARGPVVLTFYRGHW